jgi:hypothetical protein
VLHDVRQAAPSDLPDHEIVSMIVDAAAGYRLGLVFDHRRIDV